MSMNIDLLLKIGLIGGLIAAGFAYRFIMKKANNVFEETAEELIKDNTGIDIDLSPDVKEKDEGSSKR